MEFYNLAIIGATFAGIGAASACKGRAVVLETRQQIGYEFISSYNYGKNWILPTKTDAGLRLKNELIQRNILSNGGLVHLPALMPVLCNYVMNHDLEVLLMTEVIAIEKVEDVYEITIYTVSGLKKIRAGEILDTTETKVSVTDRYLNAMLCGKNGRDDELMGCPALVVVKGLFTGECILKYKVNVNDGWITAREKLQHFWEERPATLASWTISSIASCFELKANRTSVVTHDNFSCLCSAIFDNPLQAFEAGLLFDKNGGDIL